MAIHRGKEIQQYEVVNYGTTIQGCVLSAMRL